MICFGLFLIGAGGGTLRYHRIVFGGLPLAVALACAGAAAFSYGAGLRRRAWIGVGIGAWLLALGALTVWMRPSLVGGVRFEPLIERKHALLTLHNDRLRTALFEELRPVELSNCRLERFGEPHDGGYLLCGNLLDSIKTGYSYGISGYDQWGCDVARKFNVRVHQYDCFNLTVPACPAGATVFHAECIGPVRETDKDGRIFDTLENQFARNGDGAHRVVVKMDVEGAEWETLLKAPSELLQRIDQFVVELHETTLEQQLAVVRRLKEFFLVANVHFNNYTCAERFDPFPAFVYEVLFVNKRIAVSDGHPAVLPNPLSAPNNSNARDCQVPVSRWSAAVPSILGRFLR